MSLEPKTPGSHGLVVEGGIQAIYFDLFATLVSVSKAAGDSGRETADILGIDRSEWNRACFSDQHDICNPTCQVDIIRGLALGIDPDISEATILEAAEQRQQRFDYALLNVEQEILSALERLKSKGLLLGLISNASTDEVRAWPGSPLSDLLDLAVFSCDCGYKKPDPRIYRHALALGGVAPGHTLFVGDGGSREHAGARDVGLLPFLSTHFIGHHSESRLQQLELGTLGRIPHISELTELVERFKQGGQHVR